MKTQLPPKCTTLSKAPLAACKEECLLIQYYNQLLTAFTQDRDDRANYQREKGTGAAAAAMRGTTALQTDRYMACSWSSSIWSCAAWMALIQVNYTHLWQYALCLHLSAH